MPIPTAEERLDAVTLFLRDLRTWLNFPPQSHADLRETAEVWEPSTSDIPCEAIVQRGPGSLFDDMARAGKYRGVELLQIYQARQGPDAAIFAERQRETELRRRHAEADEQSAGVPFEARPGVQFLLEAMQHIAETHGVAYPQDVPRPYSWKGLAR